MQCSYYQQRICRSCTLLDQSYANSIAVKQHALGELFPALRINAFETSEAEGCRIRARIAVTGDFDSPQFGFIDENRNVIAVDQCPLHHPLINGLIRRLKPLIANYRLQPWSVATGLGELRHVIVTASPLDGKLMLQFVLRSREAVDRIRSMWRQCRDSELSGVDVLSVNLQPVRSSQLTGGTEILISDSTQFQISYDLRDENQRACVTEDWSPATLFYGPQSFVQTNHAVASRLYGRAGHILRASRVTRLLDVYCGVGAFSLLAAAVDHTDACKLLINGFDISADAILCAQKAASCLSNVETDFRVADAGSYGLNGLDSRGTALGREFDAIVCNPPRRGLDEGVHQLLATIPAPLFLYSSCNPTTLARDMDRLKNHYHFEELTPFDMFPFSQHMEVLTVGYARR